MVSTTLKELDIIPSSTSSILDPLNHRSSPSSNFSNTGKIWVEEADEGFIEAAVLENLESEDVLIVQFQDGSTKKISRSEVQWMNPPKYEFSNDLADLTYLNEGSVLHNLKHRYYNQIIYTYSGLFLVAINPYKWLPIYNEKYVAQYRNKKRNETDPHIFATADNAYRQMIDQGENQSILITGESGAGKTENTKKVIHYLANIAISNTNTSSQSPNNNNLVHKKLFGQLTNGFFSSSQNQHTSSNVRTSTLSPLSSNSVTFSPSSSDHALNKEWMDLLEKQILSANPILESFGNAQTIKNNNSSRFGKFIRLHFSSEGILLGANIERYLLEKSRVTHQNPKERNFHIFYQFLKGAPSDLKKKLHISGDANDYGFLKHSKKEIEGVNDAEEYKNLMTAMTVMKFSDEEIEQTFRIIAGILHLANIPIRENRDHQAEIFDTVAAQHVCDVLGLSVDEFLKAILHPTIRAGKEIVTQGRSKEQVEGYLDSMARSLYDRLFGTIVDKINQILDPKKSVSSSRSLYIGVLDIAGFEIFEKNSFEQLCINYTNEKLQQFFNHHMFILEQAEYKKENVAWDYIDFGLDLQPTIDFIEKSNPVGLLALLDEDCVMPKATDRSFTQKLHSLWKGKSPKYDIPRFSESGFFLSHYAARVEYHTDGWLEKNKDPLNESLAFVLSKSSVPLLAHWFAGSYEQEYNDSMPTDYAHSRGKSTGGSFRTVSQKYKEQLSHLMGQLYRTQPHFVRCILPNLEKKVGKIQSRLVLEQLRCNGVLEGIRICRQGFPNRILFLDFKNRYEILKKNQANQSSVQSLRQLTLEILDDIQDILDPKQYRIGISKVFFKAGVLALLEQKREEKVNLYLNGFLCICKAWTIQTRGRRQADIQRAILILQKNARTLNSIKEWSWWKLYMKLKPLLNISRVDSEMKEKDESIKMLELRLSQEEERNRLLLSELTNITNEKKNLDSELASERSVIDDQNELLSRLRNNIVAMEEENVRERSKSIDLQKEMDVIQLSHKNLENTAAEGQNEMQSMKNKMDSLTSEKENIELSLNKLVMQQESIDFERGSLEKEKNILEEKVKTMKVDLVEKEESLIELKKQYSLLSNNLSVARDNFETEKSEREVLSKIKADLSSQVEMLEIKNRELQLKYDEIDSISKFKEEKLKDLSSSLESKESKITQYESELLSQQKDLELMKLSVSDRLDEIKNLEQSKNKAEQDLLNLKRVLDQKEGLLGEQESQIRQLREQEIISYQLLISNLEKEKEELIKVNRKEIENLKIKIFDLENEKCRWNENANHLENNWKRASEQLKEELDLRTNVEQEKYQLENQLSKMKRELDDKEELLSSKDRAISCLESKYNDSQETIEVFEQQLSDMEKSKCALQHEIDQVQSDLCLEKSNRVILEGFKTKYMNENNILMAKLNDAVKEKETLKLEWSQKFSELEREKELIKETVEDRQKIYEEQKRKLDRSTFEMTEEVDKYKALVSQNEKIKNSLKIELEDLKLELERTQYSCANFEKAKESLEISLEKILVESQEKQKRIDMLEIEMKKTIMKVNSLSLELTEANESYNVLKKSKEALEQELSSTTQMMGDEHSRVSKEVERTKRSLHAQLDELAAKNDELMRQKRHLEEDKAKLEFELQSAKEELGVSINKLEDVKRSLLKEINELGARVESELRQKLELAKFAKGLEEALAANTDSIDLSNSENEKKLKKQELQIKDISGKLETEEKMRKNYEELAFRYEKKCNELLATMESSQASVDSLERNKRLLESELLTISEEVQVLRRLKIELTETKKKLEKSSETDKSKIEELQEANAILLEWKMKFAEHAQNEDLLEIKDNKILELEEDKSKLGKQLKVAEIHLEEKVSQIQQLERKCKNLKDQMDEVKASLESESRFKLEESERRKEVEAEFRAISIKLDKTLNRLKHLDESNQTLQAQYLESLSRYELLKEQFETAEITSKKQTDQLKAEAENSKKDYVTSEKTLLSLQREKQNQLDLINELEKDNEIMRKDQENIKTCLERNRLDWISELHSKEETWNSQFHALQEEAQSLLREQAEEKVKVLVLQEDNFKAQSKLREYELILHKESEKLSLTAKEKALMEKTVEEQATLLEEVKSRSDTQTRAIAKWESEAKNLKVSLEETEQNHKQILLSFQQSTERRIKGLRDDQDQLNKTIVHLKNENEELKNLCKQSGEELEKERELSKQRTVRLKNLEANAQALEKQIEDYQKEAASVLSEKATMEHSVKTLKIRILQYENPEGLSQEISDLSSPMFSEPCTISVDGITSQRSPSNKYFNSIAYERLYHHCEDLSKSLEYQQKEKQQNDKFIKSLERKLKEISLQMEEKEREMSILEKKVIEYDENKRKLIDSLSEEKKVMEKDQMENRLKIRKLELEVERLLRANRNQIGGTSPISPVSNAVRYDLSASLQPSLSSLASPTDLKIPTEVLDSINLNNEEIQAKEIATNT